ncbi:MAG: UDP-glucose 4-epimerase GalE [Actinomycetota bacterium]|nr:UDP-glucose 4-epimerase GalE [Actinomycetota bacterium]
MRLIVTGGAGYIGSVTAALLLDRGHDVVVLDNLATGYADAVPPGARLIEVDLLDAAAIDAAFDRPCDGVLHFAARALVGESVERPDLYFRTNIVGTLNLLDAMRAHDVARIVFSSSAATYGEPDGVPIRENAPTRPTNPYGASKLAVDYLLHAYAVAYGVAAVSLRYFNVAGAYRDERERHDPETHLIPNLLTAVRGEGTPFRLFGTDYPTPDGTCIRDYVHVEDLAEAHLLALDAATPGDHRIYNLGSGAGFSVRDVLKVVQAVTGREVPTVEGPRRPGDPARLVASSEKIRTELGWTPQKPSLEAMVRDAWAAGSAG